MWILTGVIWLRTVLVSGLADKVTDCEIHRYAQVDDNN
jgi:hypothetical protein